MRNEENEKKDFWTMRNEENVKKKVKKRKG